MGLTNDGDFFVVSAVMWRGCCRCGPVDGAATLARAGTNGLKAPTKGAAGVGIP